MGKIKVAALGNEEEQDLRDKQKVKREEKKKRAHAEKVHLTGMKGGAKVKSIGAESEEEINKMVKLAEDVEKVEREGIKGDEKTKSKKKREAKKRGKRYQEALMKVEKDKLYPLSDAIKLLRDVSITKFDSTVELHINTIEKGLRGTVKLPHGTGKEVKVKIADGDSIEGILKDVDAGKIDFDVLVAHPQVMPKLARIAKFLGPKGLMPNPKNGTISPTPEKIADKFKGGEIQWKTEADFPIIHLRIGKMSFADKQIEENITVLFKSIGDTKIKSVTLKSSMSPGIKLLVEKATKIE